MSFRGQPAGLNPESRNYQHEILNPRERPRPQMCNYTSGNHSANRMIEMKSHFTVLAIAALLVVGPAFSSFAEDAPAPQTPAVQTATPAAQPETPPPSVPRPSIAPKTAERAAPSADTDPLPPPHRRYAHHHRRWGYYRTAYWEPFPIYWPHLHHDRIHWNRVSWLFRF
jgi:hypothetical protein